MYLPAQTSTVALLLKPMRLPVKLGVFGATPFFMSRNVSSSAFIDAGELALNNLPAEDVINGNSPVLCIFCRTVGFMLSPLAARRSHAAISPSNSPRVNLRIISIAFVKFCRTFVCADVVPKRSANRSPSPPNSDLMRTRISRYHRASEIISTAA